MGNIMIFKHTPSPIISHHGVQPKHNKEFMILSALGILFVIDDHTGESIGAFTQIFPYDSFYMPMFVFISGYFFSDKHCQTWGSFLQFIKRKITTTILPFLFWVLFYGILTTIFQIFNIFEIGKTDPRDLLYNLLTSGGSFSFNDSAWFVPLLFGVIISYCLLRRVFLNHWNDYAAMILLAILGAASAYLAHIGYITPILYMVYKVSFFLQFYQLAVLFRNKLEAKFDRFSTLSVCLVCAISNLLLLAIYGDSIQFPLCATMRGFQSNNPFLPLITSITGIAFWLKISKCLVPVLGNSPVVNFISSHTAFLMTHHLLVKHIFIGILILLRNCGMTLFAGINTAEYRTSAWYVYSDHAWCVIACFLFTVSLCVALCYCWESFKSKLCIKKQLL